MKKQLWFFVIFVVFAGCTKFGKNISISGYVRNPVSGEYYADVKIKLMRTDNGIPGGFKDVKTVFTNADGYFELDHYGGYNDYVLGIDLEADVHILGWFEAGVHVGDGRMNVDKGRPMHPIFEMVEFSNSKLIINNVNCQGPGDTLVLYQGNQINTFDASFGWEHLGCAYWETNGYSEIPMGYVYYRWEVTRNGITDVFTDTVYYGEGEYKTYTINY